MVGLVETTQLLCLDVTENFEELKKYCDEKNEDSAGTLALQCKYATDLTEVRFFLTHGTRIFLSMTLIFFCLSYLSHPRI